MKTRNQLNGDNGYPKLLRIEPGNESSQARDLFHDRPHNASGLNRSSVAPARPESNHRNVAGSGFGATALRPSGSEYQYNSSRGYVRYNNGREQDKYYNTYSSQSSTGPKSDTGSNSNIYLGGRTSSYGPSGCNAVQKQYSFGRYSTSTGEDVNMRGKEAK